MTITGSNVRPRTGSDLNLGNTTTGRLHPTTLARPARAGSAPGSSSMTWTASAWFTFEVPTSSSWTVQPLNQRSSGCLFQEDHHTHTHIHTYTPQRALSHKSRRKCVPSSAGPGLPLLPWPEAEPTQTVCDTRLSSRPKRATSSELSRSHGPCHGPCLCLARVANRLGHRP